MADFFPTAFPTGFKKPKFYGHFWGATRSPASDAIREIAVDVA
jgi:hypothetical protein